jgi:hypothetical protein
MVPLSRYRFTVLPRSRLIRVSPQRRGSGGSGPEEGLNGNSRFALVFAGLSMEYLAQFHFGPIQDLPPAGRERFAAAVDLEIEHRHGRPEGARFASPARLSGPFQRQRDLSRAALLKDSALQVEGVASLHEASGWRFRHAGSRGPDGSDSGTMWIDDEYGLLLGYHAEDMQGRSLDWTVTTVSFEPLPPELFELPDNGKHPDKRG